MEKVSDTLQKTKKQKTKIKDMKKSQNVNINGYFYYILLLDKLSNKLSQI